MTTTGAGELVVQTGEIRFVADCKAKPVALVGHIKMILALVGIIASCGGTERLNTVPKPELPPSEAVPYRVFPERSNGAQGRSPSMLKFI